MDSSGFDPHLNITVPLLHIWPQGSNASLFNPYNFSFANRSEWPGFSEHQVWYTTCVYCNFPISPIYCTLQRFLLLAEVIFALVTLALDYVWLSSIAVAAVLNYTTVAAVHWIVLQCVQDNSTLDLDNWATIRIVENSIFLAYPLLQWSQLLRKKEWANTRYIIACWAILLCSITVVGQFSSTYSPEYPPAAEIYFQSYNLRPPYFQIGIWYPDTINALALDVADGHFRSLEPDLGPCSFAMPVSTSSLRRGQELVPTPHFLSFFYKPSFKILSNAFTGSALTTTIFTVAACFHGKLSTEYVRAKIYLLISGPGGSNIWRNRCAVVSSLLYYALHFLNGVLSLPVAISCFVINELALLKYPDADHRTYVGQWGSCIGAVMIFVAVAVNQSSMVEDVGTSLKWALLAPLRRLSPHVVSQLEQPDIHFKFGAPHKDIFLKAKTGMKSIITTLREEHADTIEWIRHPGDASKAYIEKENMSFAAQQRKSSVSGVPAAGAAVVVGSALKGVSNRPSEEEKAREVVCEALTS